MLENSYKYFDWQRFFEGKPTLDEIQTAAKMAADWSTSPSGQIDGIEREGKKPSDLELLNADYSFSTAMLKGDLMTAE